MEKYKKVEKPKQDVEIKENEIRITTQGKMRNYISYATGLFREKNATEIVLKAMGRAINKTVTIAEIIKRRIANLHQITQIESTDIKDVWEPLEYGLDKIETTRHVSSITITLSTNVLDITSPGYQPPIPADQVHPADTFTPQPSGSQSGPHRRAGRNRGSRGRGDFRGDFRGGFRAGPSDVPTSQGASVEFPDTHYDAGGEVRGYRGRGRSRARGGRGRGNRGGYRGRGRGNRGGYNNGTFNNNNGTFNNNNNNNNGAYAAFNNNNNNNNGFNNNAGFNNTGNAGYSNTSYNNENLRARPRGRGRSRGRGRGRGRGANVNQLQQQVPLTESTNSS